MPNTIQLSPPDTHPSPTPVGEEHQPLVSDMLADARGQIEDQGLTGKVDPATVAWATHPVEEVNAALEGSYSAYYGDTDKTTSERQAVDETLAARRKIETRTPRRRMARVAAVAGGLLLAIGGMRSQGADRHDASILPGDGSYVPGGQLVPGLPDEPGAEIVMDNRYREDTHIPTAQPGETAAGAGAVVAGAGVAASYLRKRSPRSAAQSRRTQRAAAKKVRRAGFQV